MGENRKVIFFAICLRKLSYFIKFLHDVWNSGKSTKVEINNKMKGLMSANISLENENWPDVSQFPVLPFMSPRLEK